MSEKSGTDSFPKNEAVGGMESALKRNNPQFEILYYLKYYDNRGKPPGYMESRITEKRAVLDKGTDNQSCAFVECCLLWYRESRGRSPQHQRQIYCALLTAKTLIIDPYIPNGAGALIEYMKYGYREWRWTEGLLLWRL